MLNQNRFMIKSIELFQRSQIALCGAGKRNLSGTPMVMLHGVTDSWHSFEPVLPHLPASIYARAARILGSRRLATGLGPCRATRRMPCHEASCKRCLAWPEKM